MTLAVAPVGAQQSPPPKAIKPAQPVVLSPPPDVRFRQAVQQQQARDRLQQSQLEQQLHHGVSANARRPVSADPKARQQQDRARQQDLLNAYRQTPVLPRVVPKDLPARNVEKPAR